MVYIYPVSRYLKITQIYHSNHLGLDFGWHDMSPSFIHQPIVACADGVVVAAVDGYGNTYPYNKIYGNYVDVKHPDGNYTRYAHLMKGTVCVKVGQNVSQGQVLANEDNSGYSNGEHLHFEFQKGGWGKAYSVDPMPYLYVFDKSIYINPSSKWYDRIQIGNPYPVTPVTRNTRVNQIEVALDYLRCRSEVGTDQPILGYVPRGIYNVLSRKDRPDYTWYEIEDGKWCARVEGVTFYEKEKQGLFAIYFPEVSNGDKERLIKIAVDLELEYKVSEI